MLKHLVLFVIVSKRRLVFSKKDRHLLLVQYMSVTSSTCLILQACSNTLTFVSNSITPVINLILSFLIYSVIHIFNFRSMHPLSKRNFLFMRRLLFERMVSTLGATALYAILDAIYYINSSVQLVLSGNR